MPTASGLITAVQEERFRLVTDDGRTLLLTLSHHASLSGQDLCTWHQANSRVDVEFDGLPNTATGVAHAVRPVEDGSRSAGARSSGRRGGG